MTTLSPEVNDYLDYVVRRVKDTMPVSAIWLFGSYAKGTYNQHSDLDLFVVTPDKSKRLFDWMTELGYAIGYRKGCPPCELLVNYDDSFKERSKGMYTIEGIILSLATQVKCK